ncbi:MAG: 50S ribosomal protein L10 [Chloroflexota bacterium]
MPRQEKIDKVDWLQEKLEQSSIALFTDYRGLAGGEIEQLRRKLRGSGVDFHVVKNSLVRLALVKIGVEEIEPLLKGPTAVAFGSGDELKPTKAVVEYIKVSRGPLQIKGGVLNEKLLSPADIQFLSTISSRQDVAAKAVGALASPLRNLVYILSSQVRGLLTVLQGRIKQLEGGEHA